MRRCTMHAITAILIFAAICAVQMTAAAVGGQTPAPNSAEEVLLSSPNWAALPAGFLKLLGQRLTTPTHAHQFMALCENGKIFKERVVPLATSHQRKPEIAVLMLASVLTSHAGGQISNQQYGDAKISLKLALRLEPNFWPAWGRLAVIAFAQGDCESANAWADKVLAAEDAYTSQEEERGSRRSR
jgi:hypothetical protein